MEAGLAFLLVVALPLLGAPLIYLIGRLVERKQAGVNPSRWVALVVLLAAFVPFSLVAQMLFTQGMVISFSLGVIRLQMDGVGALLAGLVLVLGNLVTLFSGPYLSKEEHQEKFYALLSMMIGGMIGLGCTSDLFNLWVWFELMAIASYPLVSFHRHSPAVLEAGVKYLVQSAVGSAFVLIGIALVFGQTGSLAFAGIRANAPLTPVMLAAGALFLIGFGVKAALVPLHTWLPDAHSQAPSGISAMLSGVVIEAGLIALLRALGALFAVSDLWGVFLLGFAALNMLLGNLMALRQTQVKRLLAFSSLSHMGYILLGIGCAFAFGASNAAAGGFFHILTHGLMKGLAFLAAGALLYALYLANGKHQPLMVEDLDGAANRYPLAAFGLSVALLGLGGIPPLAGFMSKWQIFVGGFETRQTWAIVLVIFAALNSVLSLAYYAPLINRMYRHHPSTTIQTGQPVSVWMNAVLIVLTVGVVILGFWPSLAGWLTQPAAQSLLAALGG
uniref:NADH:quinone oxidoreductase/Mrp antiporter transmembrane domain-containing protein n=1 Tax=Bellilinea caldifistulae TaxID=360411 RepID=A0A7C4Q3J8_9CHLR